MNLLTNIKNSVKKIFPVKINNVQNNYIAGSSKIGNPIDLFGGSKTVSNKFYPSLNGFDYEQLQDRVYAGYWDFIHGKAIIRQLRNLTVNKGLRLEAMPERHILGLSIEKAQEWTVKTEANWNIWRKLKEVDYAEKNNFNQLESIACLSYLMYSEYFAIIRYSTTKDRVNPLQIQLINPRTVKQPFMDEVEKANERGNRLIDGIEIDKRGREIAIYIYNGVNFNMKEMFTRIPVKSSKTGRINVLHGMIQEEENQVRGIPLLSGILHELSKITDAELFELETMAANASIAGTIERESDVVENEKMNNLGRPGWNSTQNDIDATDAATTPSTEAYPKYEERRIERGGYWNQKLEPGERMKEFNTSRPNLNMIEFIDGIMSYACSCIGISIEVVKMQFGQNYSASKGTLELTWRNIEALNSQFSSDYNQPFYAFWLLGEIAAGKIITPGYDNPTKRAAWNNALWVGLPLPALNPLQEAKASETLILNGLSNREHESQRRTGTTFENNVERLARENPELAEANKSLVELEKGIDDNIEGEEENNIEEDEGDENNDK